MKLGTFYYIIFGHFENGKYSLIFAQCGGWGGCWWGGGGILGFCIKNLSSGLEKAIVMKYSEINFPKLNLLLMSHFLQLHI